MSGAPPRRSPRAHVPVDKVKQLQEEAKEKQAARVISANENRKKQEIAKEVANLTDKMGTLSLKEKGGRRRTYRSKQTKRRRRKSRK